VRGGLGAGWAFCARPLVSVHPPAHCMAKPKLALRDKSDAELENFAQGIVAAMTGNAYFPNPVPTLDNVMEVVSGYSEALQSVAARQAALREAVTRKEQWRNSLEQTLTFLANYVETASERNEAKIESAAMGVRRAGSRRGVPAQVTNLAAAFGDFPGSLQLNWDRSKGVAGYEVQYQLRQAVAEWQRYQVVTASRITVMGLTPGSLYAFRVCAIRSAGSGPWSDEAVKRAP